MFEQSRNPVTVLERGRTFLFSAFSLTVHVPFIVMACQSYGEVGTNSSPAAKRTREEVEKLIAKAGKERPDWWEAVPLQYPKTLDLSWPKPPPGWNPRKHIRHYMFSIINENPSRWKMGTKFMHHVLSVNEENPVRWQAMEALGLCYYDLLRDWARAAFWWRESGTSNINHLVGMANCYWQLGSKKMAMEQLRKIQVDYTRYGSAIKLWSEMDELQEGLRLSGVSAADGEPSGPLMGAGDACRWHDRFEQAKGYYQKVMSLSAGKKKGIRERNSGRAKAALQHMALFETLDLKRIPDGTYAGSSLAYTGQLAVAVTVREGKITSIRVTRHRERQYFTALKDTPRKILLKQGLKGIDATSGATLTSEAVIHATAKALAGALR